MHCSSNCDHTATWQNLHLLTSKMNSWRLHSDHEFIVNTIFGYVWHFSDEQEVVCSVANVCTWYSGCGDFSAELWNICAAELASPHHGHRSVPGLRTQAGAGPWQYPGKNPGWKPGLRRYHQDLDVPWYSCDSSVDIRVSLTIRAFFGRNQLPIVEGLLTRKFMNRVWTNIGNYRAANHNGRNLLS